MADQVSGSEGATHAQERASLRLRRAHVLPGWKPTAPLGDPTLFVTLVVVQALTGLCVSFVLKYCDSLVKGFSTSGGVLVATILSCVLFGFELRTAFVVGFAVVVGAFYAYFM